MPNAFWETAYWVWCWQSNIVWVDHSCRKYTKFQNSSLKIKFEKEHGIFQENISCVNNLSDSSIVYDPEPDRPVYHTFITHTWTTLPIFRQPGKTLNTRSPNSSVDLGGCWDSWRSPGGMSRILHSNKLALTLSCGNQPITCYTYTIIAI